MTSFLLLPLAHLALSAPIAGPADAPGARAARAEAASTSPAVAPDASASKPTTAPLPTRTTAVSFADDLYLDEDVLLRGIQGFGEVRFSVPEAWDLTADPVFEMHYAASPALLPGTSSITASLNGIPVGSVMIGPGNLSGGVLRMTLPRAHLRAYNTLSFVGIHHYTLGCEDPFDRRLWSRVTTDSALVFDYAPKRIEPELGSMPFPFVDARGYGPVRLTPVLAETPGANAIVAATDLALALGRLAGHRGVEVAPPVRRVADARVNPLVIGSREELAAETADMPGADGGIVAIRPHPADPSVPVLYVTGSDARLVDAARGALWNDRPEVLAGPSANVRSEDAATLVPTRQVPLPMKGEHVKLSDLSFGDRTVAGFYAPPIRIPIRLEGDAQVVPDSAWIKLHYAYSAQLEGRLSALEVRLNGIALRSVALDKPDGDPDETLTVELPANLLAPDSELELVFRLFPKQYGACEIVSDLSIWGTVFADTELHVPRDHAVDLPDLRVLRYRMWPFNLDDDTPVGIVLPDAPTAADVAIGMQLVATLTASGTTTRPNVRMGNGAILDAVTHAILVSTGTTHGTVQRLMGGGLLTSVGELNRELKQEGGPTVFAASISRGQPSVEMAVEEGGKVRLVLRAPDAEGGLLLARMFGDATSLYALDGSGATVETWPEGIRSFDLAKRQTVGSIPWTRGLRVFATRYWWVLALLALVGVAIAARIFAIWSRQNGAAAA